MTNSFIARATVTVNAPASKVWQALTDPKLISSMFGTKRNHRVACRQPHHVQRRLGRQSLPG